MIPPLNTKFFVCMADTLEVHGNFFTIQMKRLDQ